MWHPAAGEVNVDRPVCLCAWISCADLRERCVHAQYADRLPIGLERIIREVPADVVKAFYERWYRPQNMAGG